MTLDFDQIRRDLDWLRGEDGVVSQTQVVSVLAQLLQPLLSLEGFGELSTDMSERGVDLVATSSAPDPERTELGIEYRHHGGGLPTELDKVRQILGLAASGPFDRVLLIDRFGFSTAAADAAHQVEPVSVELMDLAGIETWVRRVEGRQSSNAERVQMLIRSLSHEFAKLVAADPETLDHLEWRDLERLMARVMEGLGFKVTLTPPSKDGGKDLVLVCDAREDEESFIVELKHWRTGKRVGKQAVSDFFQVIVAENRSGGLFLSTSGYADDPFYGLTEVTRQRLRLGDKTKVVLLAQTYLQACSGLWLPPVDLPEVLFEGTL